MIYVPVNLGIITGLLLTTAACDQQIEVPEGPPEEVKVCEQFIIAKLKSPSSYNLLKYHVRNIDLTTEGYLKELFPNLKTPWENFQNERPIEIQKSLEIQAKAAFAPVKRLVIIEFEASNSFGAQIKGSEYCNFLSRNGAPMEFRQTQIDYWIAIKRFDKSVCCIQEDKKIQ